MKNNKQTQELSDKITQIEAYYSELLENFINYTIEGETLDELTETLDKAKAWDIFKAKCGKGGKVASKNLSKKERIERARTANKAKQAKAQKEKDRKRRNQIAKHRI